jgi:hypothetical protein
MLCYVTLRYVRLMHETTAHTPLSMGADIGHMGVMLVYGIMGHVKWVPFHHRMARPQVADGDGLKIWRVAANILNKLSRTADRVWPSRVGVGRGANSSSP